MLQSIDAIVNQMTRKGRRCM